MTTILVLVGVGAAGVYMGILPNPLALARAGGGIVDSAGSLISNSIGRIDNLAGEVFDKGGAIDNAGKGIVGWVGKGGVAKTGKDIEKELKKIKLPKVTIPKIKIKLPWEK